MTGTMTPIAPTLGALGVLDWSILAGYFALLIASGVYFSRKQQASTDDYFLGGRSMPFWAVAVSIVATSMSAASFVGVPQASYAGNLTYLATNIGMVLAAIIIAFVFIPAFYARRVQTIYELLEQRYGRAAKQAASITFMAGRVLASGARIYIGAIPASLVLFGVEDGLETTNLLMAIGVLTAVGIVYTLIGGVASVIWTDVVQMLVLLGACAGAVVLMLLRLDAPLSEVVEALSGGGPNGGSKLTLLDFSLNPELPYTLVASVFAFTLMGVGSYGVDQDLAQRLLTCKDAKAGARSILTGIMVGIPSVALFLLVGLLLWAFYQRPDLFSSGPAAGVDDSRQVFLQFIMLEMPPGLTGLMMAGLFAAGLSSLNSAINAMASTFIADVYRHLKPDGTEAHYLRLGRIAVACWGLVLGGFACVCVYWQKWQVDQGSIESVTGGSLLIFALTVMTFAYAGLIGVFFSVLLTRRGNTASAIAALVAGFIAVLIMQPFFWSAIGMTVEPESTLDRFTSIAFAWKLTLASGLSFVVCQLGSRPTTDAAPIAARNGSSDASSVQSGDATDVS